VVAGKAWDSLAREGRGLDPREEDILINWYRPRRLGVPEDAVVRKIQGRGGKYLRLLSPPGGLVLLATPVAAPLIRAVHPHSAGIAQDIISITAVFAKLAVSKTSRRG
jgi:hypothetical protein